ncbi:MAG: helix-turn-helix domain-containing protein [Janthinobacterium lividum]
MNAAEREILTLLAQGHTMKSIAAETGRSEGSVSERLREARRKTGMGSSRELARLLRLQENGDTKTGVAVGGEGEETPPGVSTTARWQGKVLLMMLPIATIAAAAALYLSGLQVAPVPPATSTPPGSAAGDDVGGAAARWRTTFAAEARDPVWAAGAQVALERHYHAIGGADLATLSVACRATLCDVRGQAVSDLRTGVGKRLSDALGSKAFRSSVPGLHADVTNVSSFVRQNSYVISFDALWLRTDPG